MTAPVRIKDRIRKTLNFTNRIDIKSTDVRFLVGPGTGGRIRFNIAVSNFSKIASRLSERHNLTLQFERGGEAAHRIDMGSLHAFIRAGGVVAGEIDGGFDPVGLGVKINVSDPSKNHLIVAYASKGRPDATEVEIDEAKPEQSVRVVPLKAAPARGTSLLNVYCSDAVAGGWDLRLRNVEMPHLVVSPSIGKVAVTSDPRTQLLVFPAVLRRILGELAFRPHEYDDEAWVKPWKAFLLGLVPGATWEHFSVAQYDAREIERRIEEAVSAHRERYIPKVAVPVGAADAGQED